MKRARIYKGAVLLFLALTAATNFVACRNNTQADEVRIASVLPLTGPAAELGQDMKRAHELAAEYINSRPDTKRKVQIVFEDSRSVPAEGTKAVQSLLANGNRLFIVVLSTVTMAARPMLIESKSLAFLDAAHPGLTQPPHPLIFRHSQTAEAEAGVIIPAASSTPNASKLVIFYLNDEYGRSFIEAIRKMNPTVPVSEHPYEAATTDFRTVVQSSGIKDEKGAVAVTIGVGRPLGLLIKSLREQGYAGSVYASLGYIASGSRAVLGDDRAGITYTDLGWQDTEATSWMINQFRTRYSKEPQAAAVTEFQTALLIATAAQGDETVTPESIAHRIPSLSPTVMGTPPTGANDIVPKVLLRKEEGVVR